MEDFVVLSGILVAFLLASFFLYRRFFGPRKTWSKWIGKQPLVPLVVRRWVGKSIARLIKPAELRSELSKEAQDLVTAAFEEINPKDVMDYHAHLFGTGGGCCQSGCLVPPEEHRDLKQTTVSAVLLAASGCRSEETADEDFVSMLKRLAIGKMCLLSFDKFHNRDGSVNLEKTHVFTPDEWVEKVCIEQPDMFVPTVSIHPYRKDALQALRQAFERGVKMIKWLPNSMGIDPLEGCDDFFRAVASYGMVILSHGGEERAVDSDPQLQEYGNPLRMSRALDAQCKVIIAHCASLGSAEDLESTATPRPQVLCFDLFLRMMGREKWKGLLFGDISAICLVNRMKYCSALLSQTALHARLVNGSDYPLTNLRVLNATLPFQLAKLVSKSERSLLNEIYEYNPLLYDFVLKRTIRGPKGERFPASIFVRNRALF